MKRTVLWATLSLAVAEGVAEAQKQAALSTKAPQSSTTTQTAITPSAQDALNTTQDSTANADSVAKEQVSVQDLAAACAVSIVKSSAVGAALRTYCAQSVPRSLEPRRLHPWLDSTLRKKTELQSEVRKWRHEPLKTEFVADRLSIDTTYADSVVKQDFAARATVFSAVDSVFVRVYLPKKTDDKTRERYLLRRQWLQLAIRDAGAVIVSPRDSRPTVVTDEEEKAGTLEIVVRDPSAARAALTSRPRTTGTLRSARNHLRILDQPALREAASMPPPAVSGSTADVVAVLIAESARKQLHTYLVSEVGSRLCQDTTVLFERAQDAREQLAQAQQTLQAERASAEELKKANPIEEAMTTAARLNKRHTLEERVEAAERHLQIADKRLELVRHRKVSFSRTCVIFADSSPIISPPGLQVLRDALIGDLRDLSIASATKIALDRHTRLTPTSRLAILQTTRVLSAWRRGEPLVELLGDASWLDAFDGIIADDSTSSRIKEHIRSFAQLIKLYNEADEMSPAADLDVLVDLSIKTLLLNHGDAIPVDRLRTLLASLDLVQQSLGAADSIRRLPVAMRDSAMKNDSKDVELIVAIMTTSLAPMLSDRQVANIAEIRNVISAMEQLHTSVISGRYSTIPVALAHLVSVAGSASATQTVSFTPAHLRMVAFAAEVASARTPEEAAVASRRLLGGDWGYREKRRTRYVAVNGYLGFEGGSERGSGGNATYTAPVGSLGFEIGAPIRAGSTFAESLQGLNPRSGHSLGVFFQVANVGALAATRLKGAEVESGEPRLYQVLSPGVFVVLGLRAIPLSAGFGWSRTINGRVVTATGKQSNVNRLSAFFAVDAPIIRLN